MLYRQGIVKKTAPFHPTVVGDDGWTGVFGPDRFTLLPQMDYYRELPNFYPVCRINLNATSMQMKTGSTRESLIFGGRLLCPDRLSPPIG